MVIVCLLNERVNTAVDAYRNNRIKKIIFSGGNNGISNQDNDVIPEEQTPQLYLSDGLEAKDIYLITKN